jgi:hypothetical protein
VKLRRVTANNRKRQFDVTTRSGRVLPLPFSKLEPRPTPDNLVREVFVDCELGSEGFTYRLASGSEGSVHVDQVLEYNEDPGCLSEQLIYQLTLEAERRVEVSGLSRRELARRLNTSVPQLYRLLSPANSRKSMTQLISLLQVLGCDVAVVVRDRDAAA